MSKAGHGPKPQSPCTGLPQLGPGSFRLGQPAIELIGERLPVSGAKVRRSARDQAPAAELIGHVSHGKPLADVGIGVELATRIEGFRPFRNHISSYSKARKLN